MESVAEIYGVKLLQISGSDHNIVGGAVAYQGVVVTVINLSACRIFCLIQQGVVGRIHLVLVINNLEKKHPNGKS